MDLLFLIIATEAITNIISKGDIFYNFRKWLFSKSKFFHDLIDCPYCTSVWVASFLLLGYIIFEERFIFFTLIFVIHRLSNLLHFVIDFMDKKSRKDLETD